MLSALLLVAVISITLLFLMQSLIPRIDESPLPLILSTSLHHFFSRHIKSTLVISRV